MAACAEETDTQHGCIGLVLQLQEGAVCALPLLLSITTITAILRASMVEQVSSSTQKAHRQPPWHTKSMAKSRHKRHVVTYRAVLCCGALSTLQGVTSWFVFYLIKEKRVADVAQAAVSLCAKLVMCRAVLCCPHCRV